MADEWTSSTLGADADLLTGFPFKSNQYVTEDDGIKLVRGDNIVQGSLRWDGVKLWPQRFVDGLREYFLQAEDVVLAMDRPWIDAGLKYATISVRDLPCLLVQRVARLRGGPNLDSGFLRYLIGSRSFTDHVLAVQTGTAVPHISGSQIRAFPYRRPTLSEQQAIAHVLGTLDDKIELNRRMTETLERIVQAIFKSWFVDFDPVRAKADGRNLDLPKPIYDLFPSCFMNSAHGPTPKGWKSGTVRDILRLSRASIMPTDYPGECFEHYSIPAFDSGQYPASELGDCIKSQKLVVRDGCVLVSKLNPRTPRVWTPCPCIGRRRIASTEFLVCEPATERGVGQAYVYCLARERGFSEHLTSRATGTSNSHQRVRPADFEGFPIPIPPSELVSIFESRAEPLLKSATVLKLESHTLRQIRNGLLPKLLAGEIRIKSVVDGGHA